MGQSKEPMYQIEAIVGKKMHKGRRLYLVKWEGYDADQNTWEPFGNIKQYQDLIDEFELKTKPTEVAAPPTKRERLDSDVAPHAEPAKRRRVQPARTPEPCCVESTPFKLTDLDHVRPTTSADADSTDGTESDDKPEYLLAAFRNRANKLHFVFELENGSYQIVDAAVAHRKYRQTVMEFLIIQNK